MSYSIFGNWYTDTVAVYRVTAQSGTGLTTQERTLVGIYNGRVYQSQKNSISPGDTAAKSTTSDKLAVPLSADIQTGDMLMITRGGAVGATGEPERYFAGKPMPYYDPVGGCLTMLEHQEIGISVDEIVG